MRNILIYLGIAAVLAVVGALGYQWLRPPASGVVVSPASSPAETGRSADPAMAASIRDHDHVTGDREAPVVMIEYASLTCPHCRTFHVNVRPALVERFVKTGQLALVYRDFPLDGWALRAAALARCAGPDRYFAFLDLLYQRQPAWTTAEDPLEALRRIAALGGMSSGDVDSCLADEAVQRAALEDRIEGAEAFGINATPSFVINGHRYGGAGTLDGLSAAIEAALEAAPEQAGGGTRP